MTTGTKDESPIVRFGDSISETFNQIQHAIRERAYHLFEHRDPDAGDSISDWFNAQSDILTPVDLELKELTGSVVVEGDIKGYSPKEVEVEIHDGMLRVSGCHRESSDKEVDGTTESSSKSTSFFQSMSIPTQVDEDKIKVKLSKNGKLKVTVPKSTAAKA